MIDDILSDLQTSIGKSHEALKRELSKLRTGRAHAGMLDSIRVDYYGAMTPLNQLATINVPEPRMLTVRPWDKGAVKSVDKALRESDLNINPILDGDVIRIPIPQLTEERRRDLVKLVKKMGEECKVGLRKHRHDALDLLDALEDDGDASADECDRARKKTEEVVAEAVKKVDEIQQRKEKDIFEI
ncbi:MAG: ribosome recycling factor [Polyangiaceae bacterium]|jgi:ribosome recycling factor|nr:ribosome recycling factor [Polyangiaceae bacterium]